MQVIVHIAQKLEQLHAAGWVHRDLKPGNAIWLPSKNTWTLIDFGCAARIGACQPHHTALTRPSPHSQAHRLAPHAMHLSRAAYAA